MLLLSGLIGQSRMIAMMLQLEQVANRHACEARTNYNMVAMVIHLSRAQRLRASRSPSCGTPTQFSTC